MSGCMEKYDFVVGVDPDAEKSGVAFLEVRSRKLEVTNLDFPHLLDYLSYANKGAQKNKAKFIVVVEAGWMVNKSNFHQAQGHRAERIAKDVGRNHETGRKIVEMCRYLGIPVLEHFPLKKIWKGKDGKITMEELSYFTGLMGRTNQDARDAALLAWEFSGLPIRVKVGHC